jgi:membrane fusion protein, multidrug efflux system
LTQSLHSDVTEFAIGSVPEGSDVAIHSVVRRTNTAHAVLFIALVVPVACSSPPPADPPPPPEVAVVALATEPVTMTAELPGRTVAVMVSEVRPQIRGIIQKRLFTEGQQVKSGQVLYQIDPALYQADYDSAAATLARAEAARVSVRLLAERYAELVQIEAVSKQQNDDAIGAYARAEADVATARAALDTARISLEYTRITAPIHGQVSASVYTQGALVTANQPAPLTTVRQLDPIYVDITQPSGQLLALQRQLASGRLRRAGKSTIMVRLRLDDDSEYEHAGMLAFTDVVVDETTGMVRLRTRFPNPNGLLLPGMYVRAFVPQAVDENGLLVPQQSVTHNARGEAVALVVNGENKVEQRMLKTAGTVGDRWLVRDGVKPGERLIVEGGQKVQPGGTVRTSNGARRVSPRHR